MKIKFINQLDNLEYWKSFYSKLENELQPDKKLNKQVEEVINSGLYLTFKKHVLNGTFFNDKARKLEIPKLNSSKKRVVYSFSPYQTVFLKFVNFYLRNYDYLFTKNLFSYRNKIYPSHISKIIHNICKENKYYAYKIDIHDYFRSINVERLMDIIKEKIDDKDLIIFFDTLLHQNEFIQGNKIIKEEAGAMPGMPISGFFANVYLSSVDKYFLDQGIKYFRYADDIIIFDEDKNQLFKHIDLLKKMVLEKGLTMNPKKDHFYDLGDPIEFLGLKYINNIIDVSDISFQKIKAKIKRAARSHRRWMLKNEISYGQTLYSFNNKFNNKFYSKIEGEICWALWYFPSINTDETLEKIDSYFQQEARYIKTGRHSKMNYKEVTYDYLKTYGYKPLKASYYKFKKENTI